MRICGRCKKAENPDGKLLFEESPEGVLCHPCHSQFYGSASIDVTEASAASDLITITCPNCRGKSHGMHGLPCKACLAIGVVRIALNRIPIYNPGIRETLNE